MTIDFRVTNGYLCHEVIIMKICNKCKEEKDFSMFYKNSSRKDGYDTWCKSCSDDYNKQYYLKNKEKRRKQIEESEKKRLMLPENVFKKRIDRSRKRVEASFEELYSKFNSHRYCEYCGISLSEHDYSIDHVVPLVRGGKKTIDNLTFSCTDCNYLKGTRTKVEFLAFLEEYIGRFNSVR